ncbi:MAG: hypothetical protein ACK5MQ_00670 [Pikeienuella sp.]
MADLRLAFAALDRVSDGLDFQRTAEIHIVADPDWSDLWLTPRLGRFREKHPNVRFNVNGEGDVPIRLGAPDMTIDRNPNGRAADGEALYHEIFLPVGSPETASRVSNPYLTKAENATPRYLPVGTLSDSERMWRHSQGGSLEGFPLLHIKPRHDAPETPCWADWLERYPYERTSPDRGVSYALEGAKSGAGLLLCGLSCILEELERGTLSLPFPTNERLAARHAYRFRTRSEIRQRPQVKRFLDWLAAEAAATEAKMDAAVTGAAQSQTG